MAKDRIVPHDRPAVVLHARPEFPAVRALARKIDGQADAPRRDEQRVEHQPQLHPAARGDDPGIGDRQKAPQLVHLREVVCQLADDETVRDRAAADDQQDLQRVLLILRQADLAEDDREHAERYDRDGGDRRRERFLPVLFHVSLLFLSFLQFAVRGRHAGAPPSVFPIIPHAQRACQALQEDVICRAAKAT